MWALICVYPMKQRNGVKNIIGVFTSWFVSYLEALHEMNLAL